MASRKQSLDRLRKRYNYTGGSLTELMKEVILFNSQKITNKVARITLSDMNKSAKRLKNRAGKKILIPELNEIFPGRSIFVRKAVEKGKLISDTLRGKLTKNLRDAMKENGLVSTRGVTAGKATQKLINDFEQRTVSTFKSYTKRDPKFKMPGNVHQIAVTEVRSSVNQIKQSSIKRLSEKNGLTTVKSWIHNRSLSKKPRGNHRKMEIISRKSPVPIEEPFVLPPNKKGDRVKMLHPHDPNAPAIEVIGCNCDVEYLSVGE